MDTGEFFAIAIILSIPALIIAVVVLTIKYVRTNAKAVSREQFRKEAVRQASKMKYKSPVISCDYCGYKIDTKKYSNCPNCGASFSDDREWIERYGLTEDGINSKADEYADRVKQEKTEQAEKIARWIRRCLIALGIIVGALALIVISQKRREAESRYVTESDELNHYSSDTYVPVSYEIDGDGVLIDKNGVKVTVVGIYENDGSNNWKYYKIGFHVENESGQPVELFLSLLGVNGKTMGAPYMIVSDYYKDHADIIRYEKMPASYFGDPEICEMVYEDIRVSGENDHQPDAKVPLLVMKTTSTAETVSTAHLAAYAAMNPEEVLYDDHQVIILCDKDEDGRYALFIGNLSDVNYEVTTSYLRVNGKAVTTSGSLFEEILPAGYMCAGRKIYQTLYSDETVAAGAELSVSFRCEEDPSKDFSTGYFCLDP